MPKSAAHFPPQMGMALDAPTDYSPDLEQLMHRASAASDFLKALSHESRLLLLCLLAERERSVTELETILMLRQPTVSQQLARLRADGLVAPRREGKTIYYSLANDDVRCMIALIYELFCRNQGKVSESAAGA